MPEFVKVSKVAQIPIGKMKGFEVKGKQILIANVKGKFYAMDSVCTHEQGNLAEGMLEDYTITCPIHGSQFDIRTGKVSNETPWAKSDEHIYEIKVQGGDILVKL